ncbi:hypothetical protein BC830DRAFT_319515 [Chytriomyces sp. MP71]|nr:hypothetical protein BC830DRAFT_319515 [Chytriomyces sp. MP71]
MVLFVVAPSLSAISPHSTKHVPSPTNTQRGHGTLLLAAFIIGLQREGFKFTLINKTSKGLVSHTCRVSRTPSKPGTAAPSPHSHLASHIFSLRHRAQTVHPPARSPYASPDPRTHQPTAHLHSALSRALLIEICFDSVSGDAEWATSAQQTPDALGRVIP